MVDAPPDIGILATIFILGPGVDDHEVRTAPALVIGRLELEVKTLHQQRTVTVGNKNVLYR